MTTWDGPKTIKEQGGISGVEMKLFSENIQGFIDIVGYRAVEWLANAGVDILGNALPRTPWDSGELRRSGRVTMEVGRKRFIIAKGSKAGKVVMTRKFGRMTPKRVGRWLRRQGTAGALVSFHKLAKSGEGPRDVALWAHEVLNPYDSRPNPPAARKPGTGPKYLEIAYNLKKEYWLNKAQNLEKTVTLDVRQAGTNITSPSGPWIVRRVRLISHRLKRFFKRG